MQCDYIFLPLIVNLFCSLNTCLYWQQRTGNTPVLISASCDVFLHCSRILIKFIHIHFFEEDHAACGTDARIIILIEEGPAKQGEQLQVLLHLYFLRQHRKRAVKFKTGE